jgi:hypothetical protein
MSDFNTDEIFKKHTNEITRVTLEYVATSEELKEGR